MLLEEVMGTWSDGGPEFIEDTVMEDKVMEDKVMVDNSDGR